MEKYPNMEVPEDYQGEALRGNRLEKPEFPELTREDVIQNREFAFELGNFWKKVGVGDGNGVVEFPGQYLGNGDGAIGQHSSFYNTIATYYEFLTALAMTRSPLLQEMMDEAAKHPKSQTEEDREKLSTIWNPRLLVENKIMQGMKILDLGSGPEPVFARVSRAMGAEVWTVDSGAIPADYYNARKLLPEEQQEMEQAHHIVLDLNDPSADEVLQEKTGGDFNFIGQANLLRTKYEDKEPGWRVAERLNLKLLKNGGGAMHDRPTDGLRYLKENNDLMELRDVGWDSNTLEHIYSWEKVEL
jgi:hypothetical protein